MISSPLIFPPGRDAARSNEEVDLQDREGASARFCWRACVQPPPRGLARSPVARGVLQQALAARLELRLECGWVYARNGLVLATGGMRGRLSQQRLLDLLGDQLVAAQLGGSSSLPLMHGSGVRFSFL